MLASGEERSGSQNAATSSCTRAAITSREDTSIRHPVFCQSLLSLSFSARSAEESFHLCQFPHLGIPFVLSLV